MFGHIRIALTSIFIALACMASNVSSAAVVVLGGGLAQQCYEHARDLVLGPNQSLERSGSRVSMDAVDICALALRSEALGPRARAGTLNNMGVLLFVEASYERALNTFNRSIETDSSIAEAHVNRGASLVALKRWAEGVEALDSGLTLEPDQADKAYYNRAIAHEELGNIRAAYFDYMKASELSPEWEQPRIQLTRFSVRKKAD